MKSRSEPLLDVYGRLSSSSLGLAWRSLAGLNCKSRKSTAKVSILQAVPDSFFGLDRSRGLITGVEGPLASGDPVFATTPASRAIPDSELRT